MVDSPADTILSGRSKTRARDDLDMISDISNARQAVRKTPKRRISNVTNTSEVKQFKSR